MKDDLPYVLTWLALVAVILAVAIANRDRLLLALAAIAGGNPNL